MDKIPVISLFSGCGGMDLGFEQEGFIPVIAIDKSKIAVTTYNKNRSYKVAIEGNLSELSGKEIIKMIDNIDPNIKPVGVIGGPPCQSFSNSNVYDQPNDPRHLLPMYYASILKELNRKYNLDFFVFENVIGLKSKKHKKRYSKILKALNDAGFNFFEEILNSSWFGVPQYRRRVFVVGLNKHFYSNLKFPFLIDKSVPTTSVRDAIEGLPEPLFFSHKIEPNTIPYHPNHWTMNPKSKKFGKDEGFTKTNGRSFRRLEWDKPSWAVAYGHREIHVHPNGNRRLSIYEAMKLQGFPKKYQIFGNLSEQVVQVSDAVPPPMANFIAKGLREIIYHRELRIQKAVLKWFKNNGRRFPWRETTNPYSIVLAEKLLQQTTASERVVSVYETLLDKFSTIELLASADPKVISNIIEPLGLRYRSTELVEFANEIINLYEGIIPHELKKLLSLPGVGDYIARATLCFAYGDVVAIVDTNVARFLFRVYGLSGLIPKNPARNRLLIALAEKLVSPTCPREFNLGILDLCAVLCRPTNPECLKCPISQFCHFNLTNVRRIE